MEKAVQRRVERHRSRWVARVKKAPKRGDVYWVALDPTLGTEIKKTRPAVIVSNNSCNAFGTRVVVLPLTGNVDSIYPGEAAITVNGKPARAMGDQIRSLDKSRLRARIETLNPDQLRAVDDAIRITLDLRP